MLKELSSAQYSEKENRRWLSDEYFDLIVLSGLTEKLLLPASSYVMANMAKNGRSPGRKVKGSAMNGSMTVKRARKKIHRLFLCRMDSVRFMRS